MMRCDTFRYANTWKSGFAKYAVDYAVRLGSSIEKACGVRGAAPVGGMGGEISYQFFSTKNLFVLKWSETIYKLSENFSQFVN